MFVVAFADLPFSFIMFVVDSCFSCFLIPHFSDIPIQPDLGNQDLNERSTTLLKVETSCRMSKLQKSTRFDPK